MGPFPTALRQLKFLVVGIDYFTKWVEAEPLATITEKNIRAFVWKNIVCRYGIPRVLVSDNGKQFDNSAFKSFCSELGIRNHYSSPAYPQANGQVEVTNRTLLKIIKTRLEGAKGIWPDELPSVLWAYRMTASAPYASRNGVSPVGVLAVVRYAHKTLCSSSGQIPFAPSSRVLMIFSNVLFMTSTDRKSVV